MVKNNFLYKVGISCLLIFIFFLAYVFPFFSGFFMFGYLGGLLFFHTFFLGIHTFYFLLLLFFSFSFVLYALLLRELSSLFFFCYIFYLIFFFYLFFIIELLVKYLLRKIFFSSYFQKIIFYSLCISLCHGILVFSGNFYLLGSRFFIFSPLLPLCYYKTVLLPFYSLKFDFIYLFIYQLIIFLFFYLKYYFVLFIMLIFACFFPSKNEYYWELNLPVLRESDQGPMAIVFPEDYFEIQTACDIQNLVHISKKNKKNIIAGICYPVFLNDKKKYIHGVLYINCENGRVLFRKKYPPLPFLEYEDKSGLFTEENFFNDLSVKIFICSEFFIFPISRINKKFILVASSEWTNSSFTFWYKQVMRRIYDFYL